MAEAGAGDTSEKPPKKVRPGSKPRFSLKRVVRRRWRAWLRALHRDAGYLAVGLTLIYAVSGLAINHIGDWDPNFAIVTDTRQVSGAIPRESEERATEVVLASLRIDEVPRDFFFEGDGSLEIYFDDRERVLIVDLASGLAVESYKKDRLLLRAANWLHYNRGKAAWTYIADGYAIFLLFLAVSGLFMIKGRKGLLGRGAYLVLIGAAIPILYVHFSGGP